MQDYYSSRRAVIELEELNLPGAARLFLFSILFWA